MIRGNDIEPPELDGPWVVIFMIVIVAVVGLAVWKLIDIVKALHTLLG